MDVFSPKQRSEIMSRVRGKGNKATELSLIAIFRQNQIRGWRRNASVFGNPDFVFWKERVAIFVDGCFWHSCPKHGTCPASNKSFWKRKLARNQNRDNYVNEILEERGWKVLRIWQHELAKGNRASLLRRLRRKIAST